MKMEITTLMILMALALVVLAMVVGVLVLCLFHKNDELTETTELSESGELKLQDVTTLETFYHNALRGI